MTKEEAILCLKGIKNYARDTFTEQTDWQESLDMAIKALEQENQWIPVKERLPEKDREYLVTTRSGLDVLSFANDLYKVDKYDFWDKKGVSGWWWYDSEFGYIETDGVIAWVPLPQPYKESE